MLNKIYGLIIAIVIVATPIGVNAQCANSEEVKAFQKDFEDGVIGMVKTAKFYHGWRIEDDWRSNNQFSGIYRNIYKFLEAAERQKNCLAYDQWDIYDHDDIGEGVRQRFLTRYSEFESFYSKLAAKFEYAGAKGNNRSSRSNAYYAGWNMMQDYHIELKAYDEKINAIIDYINQKRSTK